MTVSIKSFGDFEGNELLIKLISALTSYDNGLIFTNERTPSAGSRQRGHQKIALQDFDPVFTTRNKRLVHKTVTTIMKHGQQVLGPTKVN